MSQIVLSNGQIASVDPDDYVWLSRFYWQAQWNPHTKSWYAMRHWRGDKYWMHREILGLRKGDKRQGEQVKSGDTLNNCSGNLRIATQSQNMWNRRPKSDNTSGYRGVSWYRNYGMWRVQIMVHGKTKHLGYFAADKKEDARDVYEKARAELHGEFAYPEAAA
jgi:hypothetical protein